MTKNIVRRSLTALAATSLALGGASIAALPAHALVPANGSQAAMVPVDLTRVVDTREGVGYASALKNNEQVSIQIAGKVQTIAGTNKVEKTVVPADADAVVVNLTAVNATEAGYFTAWTAGDARPGTSNINFTPGDTVANGATIPLSADGKISVYSRGSANLLIDVAGYFRDGTFTQVAGDAAGETNDTPTRLFDSALTPDAVVGARKVTRIKASDQAGDLVTLNLTADNGAAEGYATVWPTQENPANGDSPSILGMPTTSNLNYGPGRIVANTAVVKTGTGGYVSVYTMSEARLVVDRTRLIKAKYTGSTFDANQPARYQALNILPTAQRVMDTRVNLGSNAKSGYRKLNFLNLPENKDNLGSVVVNVTVDNAEADGFVAIGPALEGTGATTSVLNFSANEIIANRVTIPASFLGDLHVFSNVNTDVIVDVLGYTTAPTGQPATSIDASKAASTTKSSGAALTGLSKDTAIALPAYADALRDLDGSTATTTSLAGTRTFIDGDSATIVDSTGKETSVKLVDHSDDKDNNLKGASFSPSASAPDGKADYKLVPLSGLATGDYTLRVPLKTDATAAADVKTSTYDAKFSVTSISAKGAPYGAQKISQDYTVSSTAAFSGAGGETASVVTVDGTDKTVGNLPAPASDTTRDAVVASAIGTTSGAGKTYALAETTDPNLDFTLVKEAAAGAVITAAPQISVKTAGTANLSLTKTGTEKREYYPVDTGGSLTANDVTKLPMATQSSADLSSYTTPAIVTASAGQSVEITLPDGFTTSADYVIMAGNNRIAEATAVTITDHKMTVTAPKRSDFDNAKVAPSNSVQVVVTNPTGATPARQLSLTMNLM